MAEIDATMEDINWGKFSTFLSEAVLGKRIPKRPLYFAEVIGGTKKRYGLYQDLFADSFHFCTSNLTGERLAGYLEGAYRSGGLNPIELHNGIPNRYQKYFAPLKVRKVDPRTLDHLLGGTRILADCPGLASSAGAAH